MSSAAEAASRKPTRPALSSSIVAPTPRYVRVADKRISTSEAKAIAKRRHPKAKVVDVALRGNVYRVRMIYNDGRVVDVFVDAATGKAK